MRQSRNVSLRVRQSIAVRGKRTNGKGTLLVNVGREEDGFYIHTRGPKGSDGCIVPMEQFGELMSALEAAAPLGLRVVNAGRQVFDSESFSATA